MRTCSRAPARPRRRACTTRHTSRVMIPRRNRTVKALTKSNVSTTSWVGRIGVKFASTMKVASADNSGERDAISSDEPRQPAGRWRRSGGEFGGGGLADVGHVPGSSAEK